MKAVIDELGRVELPDFVQTQLGVKPGDALSLDEEDGKWFLQPIGTSAGEASGSQGAPSSVQARPECLPASSDDLNWEDLDYASVPLKPVAQISVRIEPVGSVKPILHELDGE